VSSPPVARARRNLAVLAATAAAVVVLFIYPTSTNSGTTGPHASTAPPAGIVSPSTAPGATAGSSGTSTAQSVVVNGKSTDTEFGPVQVQLTVSSNRIVSATAIAYPQESGHDRRINSYAIPVLQQETVKAQSANIDTVSGATITSNGYRTSLQSALDAAHLN
jgi:uncharacterized protein with FMN-binding domain